MAIMLNHYCRNATPLFFEAQGHFCGPDGERIRISSHRGRSERHRNTSNAKKLNIIGLGFGIFMYLCAQNII